MAYEENVILFACPPYHQMFGGLLTEALRSLRVIIRRMRARIVLMSWRSLFGTYAIRLLVMMIRQ